MSIVSQFSTTNWQALWFFNSLSASGPRTLILFQHSAAGRHLHRVGPALRAKHPEEGPGMDLDGFRVETQRLSDLAFGTPRCQKAQHLLRRGGNGTARGCAGVVFW